MTITSALCLEGPRSIPGRKRVLAEKRNRLQQESSRIQASTNYIDWTQAYYDDVLSGRLPYTSNLTRPEEAESSKPAEK